jgi:hypothetical protein
VILSALHRPTVLRHLRLFAANPKIAAKKLKSRRNRAHPPAYHFIRVNPCPSVVAPSRSDSETHHEPHRLEQKAGKFGKTCRRFLIRKIGDIRGSKPRSDSETPSAVELTLWSGANSPGYTKARRKQPRLHPSRCHSCPLV